MNWRQIHGDDSPLQVLMPCKPDRAVRRIRILSQDLHWHLLACETGGVTWSLAYGAVQVADQVEPVLAALQNTARANWSVPAAPAGEPTSVLWPAGATPQPSAARWKAEGRRPDGQPLPIQAAWFAQGLTVYQLVVLGKAAPSDAETWWSSVTFAR